MGGTYVIATGLTVIVATVYGRTKIKRASAPGRLAERATTGTRTHVARTQHIQVAERDRASACVEDSASSAIATTIVGSWEEWRNGETERRRDGEET